MSADAECIFCKILAGEIPSFKLFEDDATYAFMDINPASAGHLLVIPKHHAADVHGISDESIARTVMTAKKLAGAVARALEPDGINLVQANGPGAAQSVLHFHMHVLPRVNGDELKMNWGLNPGDKNAIKATAERIVAALT